MADYTVELYTVVNNLALNQYDKSIYERIELALPLIFDFEYPIWTPEYKRTLERKIISRYLNKEIAYAPLELWKFKLYERLNSIMPKYNQLYQSTIKEYDFTKSHTEIITESRNTTDTNDITGTDTLNGTLGTIGNDIGNSTISTTDNDTLNSTVDFTGSNTLLNDSTSTITKSGTIVGSDVPQARMGSLDYANTLNETTGTDTDVIDGESHTTAVDKTINVTTNGKILNTTNDTVNDSTVNTVNHSTNGKVLNATNVGVETFNHTTSGNNIPIADLILKYRDTIINIDNMIVEDLYDLFMLIY